MKTDNEYIAEFMDFFAFDEMPISKTKIYKLLDKKGNPIHPYYGPYRPEQMQFNRNWDWLMPVVEKLEKYHEVMIHGTSCSITAFDDENGYVGSCDHGSKIESTYKIILACLTFYDSKK